LKIRHHTPDAHTQRMTHRDRYWGRRPRSSLLTRRQRPVRKGTCCEHMQSRASGEEEVGCYDF
jgi:hypothetical protein